MKKKTRHMPRTLQIAGTVTGIIIAIGGAALTFPSRRGDAYIMDIEVATPWAGVLTPIGALILLIACWRLPSHDIGGPAIAIIVGGFMIVAIAFVVARTNWDDASPDTAYGLVGLLLAVMLLGVAGVRAWRRRIRR